MLVLSIYMQSTPKKPAISQGVFLLVSFVIPTIILFALSDPSRLGPLPAMFLALAFPIGLELYRLAKHQKPSLLSVIAILGILFVGLVAVLKLGEEWLAVRRSIVYFVGALALLYVLKFKPHLVDKGLEKILDMQAVREAAHKKKVEHLLARPVIRAGYIFAGLLLAIGAAAYILTIVIINSPAGSSGFNAEYAELRVISIPALTVPLLIGMVALIIYVTSAFQKVTGVEIEQMLKKRN